MIDSSSFLRIMNEKVLILMQLQDFKRIKVEKVWKFVSVFPFFKRITDIWKQPLGAAL